MPEWIAGIADAVDVAFKAGGTGWAWLMTLPKELFAFGLVLSMIFIIYTHIEYGMSGWGSGIAMSLLAIIFVIFVFVIFL